MTTLEGTGEELDPDDVVAVARGDGSRRVSGVIPDVLRADAYGDDQPTTNEEDSR